MSVLSDNLYLENIEEYIKDDRRIVTCKWLSRNFLVPMNAAKRMLYHYVSQHSGPLSVMYCVTGKKRCDVDDDTESVKVQLVSDEELSEAKMQYSELWSVHVYSVQLSPVKDSCVLYSSDYQSARDNLVEYDKWNTISCDIVSHDDKKRPSPPHTETQVNVTTWSSERCKKESTTDRPVSSTLSADSMQGSVKKTTGKKKKPSSKASSSSFFKTNGTATKSGTSIKKNPTIQEQLPSPSSAITQPQEQEADDNNNSNGSPPPPDHEIPVKHSRGESTVGLQGSDFEDGEDSEPSVVKKKSPVPSSRQDKNQGQKASSEVRGATAANTRKKRRRVHGMSSSDDESDSTEAKPVVQACVKRTTKRRKRVKRLVTEMYMGDDGSMVTDKHYQDVSTDASSSDEEKVNEPLQRKKTEVQSPSKRTKQSSLMSFFKK